MVKLYKSKKKTRKKKFSKLSKKKNKRLSKKRNRLSKKKKLRRRSKRRLITNKKYKYGKPRDPKRLALPKNFQSAELVKKATRLEKFLNEQKEKSKQEEKQVYTKDDKLIKGEQIGEKDNKIYRYINFDDEDFSKKSDGKYFYNRFHEMFENYLIARGYEKHLFPQRKNNQNPLYDVTFAYA